MIYGMYVRLAGIMPAVVMGIFDSLKDAIVEGLEEIAQNIADVMTDWATWGIRTQLQILGSNVLPKPKELLSGPIGTLFGANYGLAVLIVYGLIIVAVIVTLFQAFRQERTEFGMNTLWSASWLIALAVLFFPAYTLLTSSLVSFCQTVLASASGSVDKTQDGLTSSLTALLLPGNMALQFIVGFINGFFGSIMVMEFAALAVGFIFVALFYPLSVVGRPFGMFGLNQFRLMTAAIVGIPLSLLVIAFLLAFELAIIRGVDAFLPFLGGLASFVCSIVFGIGIALTPVVVFALAYSKVKERFGSHEVSFESGVDIASAPELTTRNVGEDATRDKLDYVKQFATELPVAIAAGENDAGTEATELGKQIALNAAMQSGNPYLVGGAVAYTGIKMVGKLNETKDEKGGEAS